MKEKICKLPREEALARLKAKAMKTGDGYMTIADVAEALKVSRRTVHRNKKALAEIMGTIGVKFTKQGREVAVTMG